MKVLIYTVAYGNEIFFQRAQKMIDSARRCGHAGGIAGYDKILFIDGMARTTARRAKSRGFGEHD
jgi:hypothetical protein